MKSLVCAAAAAACLFAFPAAAGQAAGDTAMKLAQADVSVRIGGDRDRHHERSRHRWHRDYAACKMITIRERHGNAVVVKKIRKC